MLGSTPIIAFAATTDGEKARAFYEDVLGLTFVGDEPYALVFDADGVMLRIFKVQTFKPAAHTVLGWRVDDIHASVAALKTKGVVFETYPRMEQDASGVWASPSGAQVAWFKDPDANVLSLTQFPK